jgi:hypothetical protein
MGSDYVNVHGYSMIDLVQYVVCGAIKFSVDISGSQCGYYNGYVEIEHRKSTN